MKHLIKQHGWFILLAAVLMFQYRTLMASWLMFDDAAHVKFILKNGLSFFYKPAAITGAIPANFTPWMYLNYWLDLKLFGLNIGRYGLHQLLSLLFVLISIYLALGKYLGKMLTLLFMAWFFITPVAHTTIYILCTRHYLEGLGFSMLSIYFYSKYTDQKSTKLLIVSAILYAVACLNKEIYVPLIGFFYLLIFLRYHDTGKIDFKAAFTYVVVAVMYVLYRAFSLSWKNLLSGYGNTPKAEANIGAIVDTVYQYFYILTDHNGLKYVLLTYSTLVVGLAVFLFLKKDYRSIVIGQIIFITCVICTIIPAYKIMPTAHVNHHYHFLVMFVFLLGFFYLIKTVIVTFNIKHWKLAILLSPVLLMMGYQYNYSQKNASFLRSNAVTGVFKRFEVEGEYILRHDGTTKVLKPVGAGWHFAGIYGIRDMYLGKVPGPTTCKDICDCGDIENIVTYDKGEMVSAASLELKCDK